jgi:hexosaminidase
MAKQVLPVAGDVRILAESALVLVAQARRAGPLRNASALDAMELGARRIDWLGAKFQFANEIAEMYHRAGADTSREGRREAQQQLADITHINGRIQDMREGFANLKQLYQQAWLAENRPYWIDNMLSRYDVSIQLWIRRADDIAAAWREFNRTRVLPPASRLGIPEPIRLDGSLRP